MIERSFAVSIDPGDLHFNSAHFITFNGCCENLHGHNFHVRVAASGENGSDAFVVDFVLLSQLAREVCATLHDKILLPGRSEQVRVRQTERGVEVESYDKYFVFPEDNCAVLPIENTTAEMLASYVCDRLVTNLDEKGALANVRSIEVQVEEADRQWGICRRELGRGGEQIPS
jgi:6-pyruvoyltetrahydropterin/6-carboxytetrahydropterin synthase